MATQVNPFHDAHETSLSRLDEHDWQVLSNGWSRGIDWNVSKLGRHWVLPEAFGKFPLFRTKREAYDAGDALIIAESHWRARQRWTAEHPDARKSLILR